MVKFNNDWDEILSPEFTKDYYKKLREFLVLEYNSKKIYPNMHNIFEALKLTSYSDVKVVILGQDPYHGENQAHGLAFSVLCEKIPPSLQNIYKELHADVGIKIPSHGNLTEWGKRGVLLLNTALTVREASPASHRGKGWETFTDCVIQHLNEREKRVVFLLWGAHAKAKQALITAPHHVVLTAAHPSPLSAHSGFFGCRHFSKANELLEKEVEWQI